MVNRKRVLFGVLAAVLAGGIFVAPPAAQACDHPRHKYCGDYDDDYYRPRRRVVYYEDECEYRPRYYRPVRRYRCGDCGRGFGSRYWLSFHVRHSSCD